MLVLSGIHLDWYECRAVFSGMLICANDALAALATYIHTCRTLQYGYILAYGTPNPYAPYIIQLSPEYVLVVDELHENSNFASGPGVVGTYGVLYCTTLKLMHFSNLTEVTKTAPTNLLLDLN